VGSPLHGTTGPLYAAHDVALLDLDGVVYVGSAAVPGAPEALAAVREHGMRLAFVTNNAARPPEAVAAHLTELGIGATAEEIITSAQAAARYLADRLPPGARVLVVGTTGLEVALRERGLTPVSEADGELGAVVQGYSPDLNWRQLAEGAVAINRGVPWVATNVDPTVPSRRGPLPGNGSLVAALRHATGHDPVVTGKPDPTMHRESLLRSGSTRPIVVGDRLDTDIEGANAVGCPSLLVLSGVTTAAVLLRARAELRPTYLGRDVSALLHVHPPTDVSADGSSCGQWQVAGRAGGWELSRCGEAGDDDDVVDALRALCAAAWNVDSSAAEPVSVVAKEGDAAAERAIQELDLAS
jgi:HAD superfamily hydrolase (TIGR01450 family)